MKRETLFLKAVITLMGLVVAALCIFFMPVFTREALDNFPDGPVYPLVSIMYASAIPFIVALYQAFRLLGYIDRNTAFSEVSVGTLKKIKYSALSISILYVVSLPFLYIIAEYDDAPGLILMGMAFVFAAFVIAVFAAVLQKLLHNALIIKSENDLTV
ncbi:DUF2975 domain-containing protein [Paenibacillus sp. strain BS8-2]